MHSPIIWIRPASFWRAARRASWPAAAAEEAGGVWEGVPWEEGGVWAVEPLCGLWLLWLWTTTWMAGVSQSCFYCLFNEGREPPSFDLLRSLCQLVKLNLTWCVERRGEWGVSGVSIKYTARCGPVNIR